MKYVDFDVVLRNQKGVLFLSEEVAKFLFKQKEGVKFLHSKKSSTFSPFNSPKFSFSHNLVLSAKNQWHIIDNATKGKGGFGSVNGSKHKIIVTYDVNKKRYQAQVIPVNDVVKIQKANEDLPYEPLLRRTIKEAIKQKNHGVKVVAVVGAEDKVITVVEDCGTSLDNLLPFIPSNKYSFLHRLHVAARIASEMLLLQQRGVVHRDLKPANICYKNLEKDQFLIIFIDFGLAEDADSQNNFHFSGTPYYMAPEVLMHARSTYQSDMYALAAILGEIFGATHIMKYKDLAKTRLELAHAPFCFDGLFTGYDVSDVDPFLLKDIKNLLLRLQSTTPGDRPTINQVNKFLVTLPARLDAYKIFNDHWAVLVKHFDEFEMYHKYLNLLNTKHHLTKFTDNLFSETNHRSDVFNRRMLLKRMAIYKEIAKFTLPASHYELSARLIKENRGVDINDIDRPYPNLEKVTYLLEQENLKFKKALVSFHTCTKEVYDGKTLTNKFINTNSTGMMKIAKILNEPNSPLEKLQQLQQLGQEKTERGLFYFFSHSKIFGKGRHENIEKLYQKLAKIDPENEQDEYLAKKQLEEITQFIQHTDSFTY
ncbi:serine/threonine protein kinase [Legionella sainthelensi]|uniref:Serine/threonine protein kinase n=1 Tax=Legionella sainthelensi TaxID=28087 RepID=A0A0W0YIY2_9GAMM|nr:protein kinase [Legionella sainthelensi]KTD56848.1 serine/threonine protein kinase [Legionella sainthelensi]VEH37059.1 serine/threonine protein kinase [Legionella sainthelensi]